jgi:hypothetical protein
LTIWYYFERNPHHRPGFPIGNPSVLAANLLPALMLGLAWLAGALQAWHVRRERPSRARLVGALLALALCGGAFALAGSRGGLLGLVAGAATIVFFGLGRRGPAVASLTALVIFIAAGVYFYTSRMGDTMARGATVRLRLYAWQYAADIWQMRPMLGAGAASFTRFGTQYSARDRFLDPAAFMGDWLEHAHNEFFEVFAEIGLFGGVTFVAAWVALLAAASRVLRSGLSPERRWLLIGMTAGIVGLLGDALFGTSLRLPGGGALFWTLVGALLAACRCAARPEGRAAEAAPPPEAPAWRRRGLAGGAAAGTALLMVGGVFNFVGLVYERIAYRSLRSGDYAVTVESGRLAGDLLLNPTRVLLVEERVLQARYARLMERVERLRAAATRPATGMSEQWAGAAAAARATFDDGLQLERRAPMMPGAATIRARAAELLRVLHAEDDPRAAAEWAAIAEATWRQHREQRPADVETLLALTGYAKSLDEYLRHLRDALRAGFAPVEWHAALQRVLNEPDLDAALGRMAAVAGPIDPGTDLDTLVSSRAPEAYRLRAAVGAARGNFEAAAQDAAQAGRLYEPMRARFPMLAAVAAYEEAEYTLRRGPEHAAAAGGRLRRALDTLPVIQEQHASEAAAPFRELLALCELAADKPDAAFELRVLAGHDRNRRAWLMADAYVRLAEMFIRFPPDRRPDVRAWLQAALRDQPRHIRAWSWQAWLAAESGDVAAVREVLQQAAAAGVSDPVLRQITEGVEDEFPAVRPVRPAE